MIMGAGSASGSMDAANLLKPALANGKIRCIGSTTLDEYRKHFEKDRALLRRFRRIDVKEPSIEDTKLILRGLKPTYEEFHKLFISDEALDTAVDLTARYVSKGCMPDKAIDIIDGAFARKKLAPVEDRSEWITIPDIEAEVAKSARIPKREIAGG